MTFETFEKDDLVKVTSDNWAEVWKPYLNIGRVLRVYKTSYDPEFIWIEPLAKTDRWREAEGRPVMARIDNFTKI